MPASSLAATIADPGRAGTGGAPRRAATGARASDQGSGAGPVRVHRHPEWLRARRARRRCRCARRRRVARPRFAEPAADKGIRTHETPLLVCSLSHACSCSSTLTPHTRTRTHSCSCARCTTQKLIIFYMVHSHRHAVTRHPTPNAIIASSSN